MQPISQKLITMTELLNDGHYHDGTSLGNQLNITRAAVWKVIKKLKQYEVPLQSMKGKGYRLASPLVLLNHKKITANLRHHSVHIDTLEKIGSTNDYLKNVIVENKKIRICLAETQTQGKGRLQRQWHSPFGQNIYFSMLYPFQKDISDLSGLSLVTGLAVCHAIESVIDLGNEKLWVKWPNDVLANKRKLAGTLIEIQAESNGFCQVIIGIGLNVNMKDDTKKNITQPWSSLLQLTHQYQDRNILCATLIDTLIDYIKRFSSKGLVDFMEEWKKKDFLFDRSIAIASGKNKHHGVCMGINEKGHILLKTSEEIIQAHSSGDTIVGVG